ncbi:hypothetical protein N7466_006566 [Penicillium verhagenii]|uniref:uncharacterized protein n=1 Tax=Penicillium verhagenii TaxID=1562060 RepID=UPI002545977D|nr:uncharacterized protein N7466_006566 [Penicillium verhagenii]KAJ5931073.1 hypothetical protein N7466_006566 [Penicillium verhagenii]
MQFITVIIATLAAVASASSSDFEKRSCVSDSASSASDFEKRSCVANYEVACNSENACCDSWQCVGATEWNAGVCIPNY